MSLPAESNGTRKKRSKGSVQVKEAVVSAPESVTPSMIEEPQLNGHPDGDAFELPQIKELQK